MGTLEMETTFRCNGDYVQVPLSHRGSTMLNVREMRLPSRRSFTLAASAIERTTL